MIPTQDTARYYWDRVDAVLINRLKETVVVSRVQSTTSCLNSQTRCESHLSKHGAFHEKLQMNVIRSLRRLLRRLKRQFMAPLPSAGPLHLRKTEQTNFAPRRRLHPGRCSAEAPSPGAVDSNAGASPHDQNETAPLRQCKSIAQNKATTSALVGRGAVCERNGNKLADVKALSY